MDKKNTTIGVLLILAAFAFMFYGQRHAPAQPHPDVITPAGSPSATTPAATAGAASTSATNPPGTAPAANADTAAFAAVTHEKKDATITTLENDYVVVHLTDFGGAIRDVALKKYAAVQGEPAPVVFNQVHADPMLAFVDLPGLDRNTGFELVSASKTEVVYRAVYDGRIEVTRRYTLPLAADAKHDPYQLRHETTFRNLTDKPILDLSRFAWSVGTAQALNDSVYGRLVTTGFSNGKDQTFIPPTKLAASGGMFGLGAHDAVPAITSSGPIVWSAVDTLSARDAYVAAPTEAGYTDGVSRQTRTNALIATTATLAAATVVTAFFTDFRGRPHTAVAAAPLPGGAAFGLTHTF